MARYPTGTFVPSASREIAQRAEIDAQEAEKRRRQDEEERLKQEKSANEATRLATAMDTAGPERIAQLREGFIINLKKTNKTAFDLYQRVGFNSVGFEMLFRGYLTKELLPVPS